MYLTVLDNMGKSNIMRIFEQNSVLHQARMREREREAMEEKDG